MVRRLSPCQVQVGREINRLTVATRSASRSSAGPSRAWCLAGSTRVLIAKIAFTTSIRIVTTELTDACTTPKSQAPSTIIQKLAVDGLVRGHLLPRQSNARQDKHNEPAGGAHFGLVKLAADYSLERIGGVESSLVLPVRRNSGAPWEGSSGRRSNAPPSPETRSF